MRLEFRSWLEIGQFASVLHVPYVYEALERYVRIMKGCLFEGGVHTLLLPATRQLVSLATVTLLIGTSSSGIYDGGKQPKSQIVARLDSIAIWQLTSSCVKLRPPKSQILTAPL